MEDGTKTIWDDYEELRDHWLMSGGLRMSHVVVQKKASLKSGTRRAPSGFA